MSSAIQVDTVEEKYTSMKTNVTYVMSEYIKVAVDGVILKQQPEEELQLKLAINSNTCFNCRNLKFGNTYSNRCACTSSKISVMARLDFVNILHLFSHAYCYKVVCKLRTLHANGTTSREMMSFQGQQMRTKSYVEIEGFTYDNGYLNSHRNIQITLLVHRFNATFIRSIRDVPPISFADIIANDHFGDVSIKVHNKTFYAHIRSLSTVSDVFRAMFEHKMSESQNRCVEIPDFDGGVVEQMLMYIYTDDVKDMPKYAMSLYKVADKYQMDDLKNRCYEYLMFYDSPEDLVSVLEIAMTYNLSALLKGIGAHVLDCEADFVQREDYQALLIRRLTVANVAMILRLCDKYSQTLNSMKQQVFAFIKKNVSKLSKDPDYLTLFNSHAELMREIFVYLNP